MNVQFAVKDDEVYLIEVNPRASRTVPFVAKAVGSPIAKIAARVMAGEKLADLPKINRDIKPYVAVKEAVFPFARFPGVDPVLSHRNEVHRRSHGNRQQFQSCLRQGAARRRRSLADRRARVRVGQGQRQAASFWAQCASN
jgi:carbamoylphosphate synthase large subunit